MYKKKYNQEAQKIIKIIEEKYNLNWNDKDSLINLTNLNLCDNNISDITPLKELINLSELDLISNSISDITPLKDLKNLTVLELTNNFISDVTPLKNLTNLIHLDLISNSISDITPLKKHIELGIEVKLESPNYGIILQFNPIKEPPLEIVKQGNNSILEYWELVKKSN